VIETPFILAPFEEMYEFLTQEYGVLGIGVIMFLESAGVPFISSLVLLTAGSMITSGKISFFSAFAASMGGIILGSLLSYSMGYFGVKAGKKIKENFSYKKIKKTPYHQTKIYNFMQHYGDFSIFVAQLWGATRTFISFPAGAFEMNIFRFLAYTTLGGCIFSLVILFSSLLLNFILRLLFRVINHLLQLPWWLWFLIVLLLMFWYWGYFIYNKKI